MVRQVLILAGALIAAILLAIAAARVSRQARALHGQPMGLLDHLRELRYRVLAILATGGGVALLVFVLDVRRGSLFGYNTWVPAVSVTESIASRTLKWLLFAIKPEDVRLVVMTPFEAVAASLEMSIILGLLVASPVVAYHLAAFLAPALHENERRVVATIGPLSLFMFLAGAVFAMALMVPQALKFLYAYAAPFEAEMLARPQDLLRFAGLTSLLMGVAFQMPLVMVALSRVGLVHPRTFARHWRGVTIVVLVIAAIVTPDPTIMSQMFVFIPTMVLYAAGLVVAYMVYPKRRSADDPSSKDA